MVIEDEDNFSKEEAVKLCQTIENIEVAKDPTERPKTAAFLEKYELLDDDVREIIHSIELSDYVSGPEEDRNPKYKKPVWKFNKYVNDIKIEVYLKIKFINHKHKIFVFSIHEEGLYDED